MSIFHFVPAQHFLLYLRAVESILFGAGVGALCGLLAGLIVRMLRVQTAVTRLRIEHGLVIAALIGLLIAAWPAYLEREDFNDLPRESALYGARGAPPRACLPATRTS